MAVCLPTSNLVWHLAPWLVDVWECKLQSINSLCGGTVNSMGKDKAPECTVKKIFSTEFQNIKWINGRLIFHWFGGEAEYPKVFLWKQLSWNTCNLSYIELLWFILNLCFLHNKGARSTQWFFLFAFFNKGKLFSLYRTDFHSRFPSHMIYESFLKRTTG